MRNLFCLNMIQKSWKYAVWEIGMYVQLARMYGGAKETHLGLIGMHFFPSFYLLPCKVTADHFMNLILCCLT